MSLPIEFVVANGTAETTNGTFIDNTLTWTQTTAVTGDNIAVVAYLMVSSGTSLASATASGTYGGVSMTASKIVFGPGTDCGALVAYRLSGAPTGAQTVSVTINGMTQNLVNKQYAAGVAVYRNVQSVKGAAAVGNNSNAVATGRAIPFTAVNMDVRDVAVGVHGRIDATAFSSYNLNSRLTNTEGNYARGLIGDSIGLQQVPTFYSTATASAADYEAGVGVYLMRDPNSNFMQMF
jgi:hypothetical protein